MMRWRKRTDDARRMKGDPAATYQELEATVAALTEKLAEAVAANTQLHDRNERLHRDMAALRARFPRLDLEARASLWTCPVEGHTKVEWVGNVARCPTCGATEDAGRLASQQSLIRYGPKAVWPGDKAGDDASWVEFDKRAERRDDR